MIRISIPSANFKEIEKYDNHVYFIRFDQTVTDDIVDCTEMGVMIEGAPNYSKLVAAIITGKYDYDTQIAMLANKDDGDPEHAAAWTEFQAWRTEAKRIARIEFPETQATDDIN